MPERAPLSLVIPAYNESERLPPYLAAVRAHFARHYDDRCEVLVVDDGSRDALADWLFEQAGDWPRLKVLRHERNQGKGAAVRTGMLAAEGDLLLFGDADGATPIEEERRLADAIRAGADVAIGSRLLQKDGVRQSRHLLRGLSGRAFAAVARRMLALPFRDTQCGFKMFRRDVGRRLFSLLEEPRYLFDLEVLGMALRLGYRVAEVPVNWTEIPGGRFRPARELPRVFFTLLRLRRRLGRLETP